MVTRAHLLAGLVLLAPACSEVPSEPESLDYPSLPDDAAASRPPPVHVFPRRRHPGRRFSKPHVDFRTGELEPYADEDHLPLGAHRPCPNEVLERLFAIPGVVQEFNGRLWVLRPALPYLQHGGEETKSPEFYSDGLLRVALVEFPISRGHGGTQAERAWGYVDRDGNVAIPPVFRYASTFSEGLAAVQPLREDCVGFIDPTGAWVIPCGMGVGPPAYFSEGLAALGPWYVDREGKRHLQAPPAPGFGVNAGGAFRRGRAYACRDDMLGILDRKGRFRASEALCPILGQDIDDAYDMTWPQKFLDAERTGLSEGRRVRGDQCTFEVTDAAGRLIFDHILLDPITLPLSEGWPNLRLWAL